MRKKSLNNYFMLVGRIAVDVVKRKGVPTLIAADRFSAGRVVYDINMNILSTNIKSQSDLEYVNSIVSRNLKLLQMRADDLQAFQRIK